MTLLSHRIFFSLNVSKNALNDTEVVRENKPVIITTMFTHFFYLISKNTSES